MQIKLQYKNTRTSENYHKWQMYSNVNNAQIFLS